MANLERMKVAILVTDGFEQVELIEPRQALDEAGADTQVVSPRSERVRGWSLTDSGERSPGHRRPDRHQFRA
jgi:protease I